MFRVVVQFQLCDMEWESFSECCQFLCYLGLIGVSKKYPRIFGEAIDRVLNGSYKI